MGMLRLRTRNITFQLRLESLRTRLSCGKHWAEAKFAVPVGSAGCAKLQQYSATRDSRVDVQSAEEKVRCMD